MLIACTIASLSVPKWVFWPNAMNGVRHPRNRYRSVRRRNTAGTRGGEREQFLPNLDMAEGIHTANEIIKLNDPVVDVLLRPTLDFAIADEPVTEAGEAIELGRNDFTTVAGRNQNRRTGFMPGQGTDGLATTLSPTQRSRPASSHRRATVQHLSRGGRRADWSATARCPRILRKARQQKALLIVGDEASFAQWGSLSCNFPEFTDLQQEVDRALLHCAQTPSEITVLMAHYCEKLGKVDKAA